VAPPPHAHPSQATKPNKPWTTSNDNKETDSQHTTGDEANTADHGSNDDSTNTHGTNTDKSGNTSSNDNDQDMSTNDQDSNAQKANDDNSGDNNHDNNRDGGNNKHASKGNKHENDHNSDNNPLMCVDTTPGDNKEHPAPLSNDNDSDTPMPVYEPPIPAVETRGGAAGDDTHPVSPTTAGPRAGSLQFLYIVLYSINSKHLDTIMRSPSPLSRIELEGASLLETSPTLLI
jgi:hypothetical protein